MVKYSEAEKRLIKSVSAHWSEVIELTNITPSKLYQILAFDQFVYGTSEGPHIEALRKVCEAIDKCSPCRLTEEFDKLCEFEED